MKLTIIPAAVLTTVFVAQFANAELTVTQHNNAVTPNQTTSKKVAVSAPSTSTHYKLDPAHANVRFAIDHFGTSTNYGTFYGITGDMVYDPAKRTGNIDVTIPMTTLDTGNTQFTNHLKSADFFNAQAYPTANFKSTKFHFNKGKVTQVDGTLTLLGKTKPVSLKATKFNCYESPMLKAHVCGGDFETTIDRTQWGMDTYVNMGFSKQVKLNIQVEAVQQ